MKLAIVYPVLNQFRKCIEAMDSVVTEHEWFPVIVKQWENPKPLSAAWNWGIEEAERRGADYILVSNDDVIYAPCTIDALIRTHQETSDNVIMVTGCNERGNCPDPNMMRYWPTPENPTMAEHPDFACFSVERGFIATVGRFDANFIPAYF